VETKVLLFLQERNLDKYLVKKLAQYCDVGKAKLLQGDKKLTLISYGLICTFFKDLEDNRTGDHPNDVAFGFHIKLSDIVITLIRDIMLIIWIDNMLILNFKT